MKHAMTPAEQHREVDRQVNDMLASSASFLALPSDEREKIRSNTSAIVDTMVQNKIRQAAPASALGDPFAVPLGPGDGSIPINLQGGGGSQQPQFTGGATQPGTTANFGPQELGDFGTGIALGVAQTGQLLREVNFPAFVSELVQGVFQAVVDASIQQMKAYGELVQSVTMSLNDFRDQNVSQNQGRDHLASKYPTLMQVNISDSGPRVGPRPGWDDEDLPNFREEMGLDSDVTDLDEETIESVLVPAARNDLAKQRQSLLATMLLMGINRIVVTDGKINAKLKFDFRARDSMTTHAQEFDYENMGTTKVRQRSFDRGSTTGEDYSNARWRDRKGRPRSKKSGESSRWSTGEDQMTEAPVIFLTEQETQYTEAEIVAEGQLRSDVSLNFKSETFDLNQIATAGEIFQLERVRSAGRGAAPPEGQEGTEGGTTTTPDNTATAPA